MVPTTALGQWSRTGLSPGPRRKLQSPLIDHQQWRSHHAQFLLAFPLAASGLLLTACGGASAPEPQPYTVSGTVEDENGHAIEGVTISFGGAADDTTTDSNGNWSSAALSDEVTVTPTHDDYTFRPRSRTVSKASSTVDFTGMYGGSEEQEPYTVSGTVTDAADVPVEGVTITLSFNGQVLTITTDAAGFWEQDGLHGTVTATPTRDGFVFDPEFEEHSETSTAVDFTGEPQPCTAGDVTDRDDPCIITYVEQLQLLEDNLSGPYALGRDIDASATAGWNSGDGFKPIGDQDEPFLGTLDGRDNSILGLVINRPDDTDVGLFGVLGVRLPADPDGHPAFGRVENLELASLDVTGDWHVGGLAGTNKGKIRNETVSGTITGAGGYATGGLVGRNYEAYAEVTIRNAHANVTVTGEGSTGGLVGEHSDAGAIEYSSSSGTVKGTSSTGGLVGTTNNGDIFHSHSTSEVNGTASWVGGLVGNNTYNAVSHSWSSGTVMNTGGSTGGLMGANNSGRVFHSYSAGDVTGQDNTGGLVGQNYNTHAEISNTYAHGDVTGAEKVGGLVGSSWKPAELSYSTGFVEGDSLVGGLVGALDYDGTVSDSYWDTETSGQAASAGGEGKTTPEMKQPGTYAAWDFTDTWQTGEGSDYPDLRENLR